MQPVERQPFSPVADGLSVYIHVPFCERKCDYCAFASAVPLDGDIERWLKLVEKEFDLWRAQIGRPKVSTLYVGGGTPSILSYDQWLKLSDIIEKSIDLEAGAEFTVEANPNTLDASKLRVWRDRRVSRVSVGVQSLDDAELEFLGRFHSARDAYGALSASLAAGFSVSADLMFGTPGQTFHSWGRTLGDIAKSGVHHISLYQLSIEPGSKWETLYVMPLPEGYAHYRWAQWYLLRHGFEQYEISNFARDGHLSRHNMNYWLEGEYLGIGPSAAGYLNGRRYKNDADLNEYAKLISSDNLAIVEEEKLSPSEKTKEAAILALRTTDGIDVNSYTETYGESALSEIRAALSNLPGDLYKESEGKIFLTRKGMRVANKIWMELV